MVAPVSTAVDNGGIDNFGDDFVDTVEATGKTIFDIGTGKLFWFKGVIAFGEGSIGIVIRGIVGFGGGDAALADVGFLVAVGDLEFLEPHSLPGRRQVRSRWAA